MDPSAFRNPAMLAALQGKLNSLVGQSSGYVESLPAPVRRRLAALENLQDQHGDIERELRDEIHALERKYLERFRPLYAKRAEIVGGAYEPTDPECDRPEEEDDEDEDDDADEEAAKAKEAAAAAKAAAAEATKAVVDADAKGVPEFWLTIFKNHDELIDRITEEDEKALKHLVDVQLSYLPDNPGFKLDFYFEPNDYFTNNVLSKTYFLEIGKDTGYGEVFYDHAEGTKINWKDGKDLTVTTETKRQRHKGTNQVRTVVRKVPANTFFQFFSPPSVPDPDSENFNEEEADSIEMALEADYQIGEIIKDSFIPNAVGWFTGEAIPFEDEDEDGEFSDEDGDEDDEDDDDDDDDDDDNDPDFQPDPKAAQPPDCKQQ